MKAIIFDIDGVVITSEGKKKEIIDKVIQKYHLYDVPGVKDILDLGLNRKLVLERIYELINFDKESVLKDINDECAILETNSVGNDSVIKFIKDNVDKYIICTNTSLPIDGLNRVLDSLNMRNFFKDLLVFETGSKVENVNFVINKYKLNPKDVLFIDDNINHIDKVKVTGVHTLHFEDYDIDIEQQIILIESND